MGATANVKVNSGALVQSPSGAPMLVSKGSPF